MTTLGSIGRFAKHASFCFKEARIQSWPGLTLALAGLLAVKAGRLRRECYIVRLTFKDFSLHLNIASNELCSLWENFLDEQYGPGLPPGSERVVIDVGANIGVFSLQQIRQHSRKLTLIALEPDPDVFRRLERNLEPFRSECTRILLLNSALGSGTGTAQFAREGSTNSHIVEGRGQDRDVITVQMETLDHLVEGHRLQRIDLLKIDVEGWELHVLRGGLRTALPLTDRVVLEYHGGDSQETVALLAQCGFSLVWKNETKCTLGFVRNGVY